jgi:hypothetical protein
VDVGVADAAEFYFHHNIVLTRRAPFEFIGRQWSFGGGSGVTSGLHDDLSPYLTAK